jgi:ATP-dependent DNA helicase RecG
MSIVDAFRQLGLSSPEQMLLCCPAGYDDLRERHTNWSGIGQERVLVEAHMCPPDDVLAFTKDRKQQPRTPTDMRYTAQTRRLSIPLRDATGEVATLSVFGNVWAWRNKVEGERLTLSVSPRRFGRDLYFQDVEMVNPVWVGRIRPRYRGIQGKVSAERIERDVLAVIDSPTAYEICRDRILEVAGCAESELLERIGAQNSTVMGILMNLHSPDTVDAGRRAEAFAARISAFGMQCAALSRNVRRPHRAAPLSIDPGVLERAIAGVAPALTPDQVQAIRGIADSLGRQRPLNGLLTGDVGTGKTLAYLIPAISASQAGARVAIIAPTVILADQIAGEIIERFPSVPVARVRAGEVIREPGAIQVGTVGLINESLRCNYVPQFVVIDEQHRLSTEQCERIVRPWTHVLEVSATPIPRTVALARYSGVERFVLTTCPVEKDIWSGVLDAAAGDRDRIRRWLKHAVETRSRALFVYPSVDVELPAAGAAAVRKKSPGSGGQSALDLERAEATQRATRTLLDAAAGIEAAYPDQVAVLHGQMDDAAKADALEKFKCAERLIMVASSIVETGVDLPDLRLAVVMGAERFGAAQLHQLRGRLARQGGRGAFAMFVENHGALLPEARERLAAVAQVRDGYELAERDLELRGFGQVDGIEQTGDAVPVFRCQALSAADFFEILGDARDLDPAEEFDETPLEPEELLPLDENYEARSVTGDQIRLL